MSNKDTRILNVSRGTRLKRHQAQARIDGQVSVWVIVGVSIRDLTLPEVLSLRAAQKREATQSHLPYSVLRNEVPGFKFIPPEPDRYKFRERYPLLRQAAELLEQWA